MAKTENKSNNYDKINIIKRIVQWLLFIVVALYVITGLGMTKFQIIEPLTFGLLGKALSFKIHSNLLIPLLVLLVAHITTPLWYKWKKR